MLALDERRKGERKMTNTSVMTAREIMATDLITVEPHTWIDDAIAMLLREKISGAPVINSDGALVGILSEKDCLSILANGTFHELPAGIVADFMSPKVTTVSPDSDIYTIAQMFLTHSYRRLPVLENGHLVGQISRRDVLRGIEQLRSSYRTSVRYPDYRRPQL